MAAGYIYALVNSSMPGLVKVGKTTRAPADRAAELSGVTGVATPFIVAYEAWFNDCDEAEAFVHAALVQRGLRVSEGREFFRARTAEVIDVIHQAKSKVSRNNLDCLGDEDECNSLTEDDEFFSKLILPEEAVTCPWGDILEEAEKYYYGLDGYIVDYVEAMKLFKAAARLGSPEAYEFIGDMYSGGDGVKESRAKALEYYKEGAKKGNYFCYGAMTEIFLCERSIENALKVYGRFVALGDDDHWQSHTRWPNRWLEMMVWIAITAARVAPSNLSRFIPSKPKYIYRMEDNIAEKIDNPQYGEDGLQERLAVISLELQRMKQMAPT